MCEIASNLIIIKKKWTNYMKKGESHFSSIITPLFLLMWFIHQKVVITWDMAWETNHIGDEVYIYRMYNYRHHAKVRMIH